MATENENENPVESSLESQSYIDFGDLDKELEESNKKRKAKAKAELEKEKNEKEDTTIAEEQKASESSKKLADSLSDDEVVNTEVKTEKASSNAKKHEAKEEVKEETTIVEKPVVVEEEKKEKLVLEEDEIKNRSTVDMKEDTTEEDESDIEVNTIDPKTLQHRVNVSDDSPDNFVIDTDNTQVIVKEEEIKAKEDIEKENERKQKIEEKLEKRTGYKVFGGEGGVPCIFASDNPNIKALKEFNIPTEKIKPIADNDEDLKKSFLDQYITLSNAQDSTVVDHRISRFPLLLSGYYAEMTDYSMGELTSAIRNIRNEEEKFARKFQNELLSLFNHISWTSLKPEGQKLTFEEWLKATKFQDLNMFYFGAYDATYPGEGKYDITCGRCGNQFTIKKANRALSYMLPTHNDPLLKDTFIKDVLMEKIPVSQLTKTVVYSKANTNFDEKVLRPHNIRIEYGCPTLMDILEYLNTWDEFLTEDIPDFEAIIDPEKEGHNLLTMFSMIKSITVPVNRGKNADGNNVISFMKIDATVDDDEERMKNRRYIVKILKDLPQSEFADLFSGKEIAERKNLNGIVHILHNITCPNCSVNIPRIVIDMRVNFFIRTATVVDQISLF